MHRSENHEEYFEMVGVDLYSPDCACLRDNDYSDDYDLNDDNKDVYDNVIMVLMMIMSRAPARPSRKAAHSQPGTLDLVKSALSLLYWLHAGQWSSSSLLTLDFQEYLFCGILQFGIT